VRYPESHFEIIYFSVVYFVQNHSYRHCKCAYKLLQTLPRITRSQWYLQTYKYNLTFAQEETNTLGQDGGASENVREMRYVRANNENNYLGWRDDWSVKCAPQRTNTQEVILLFDGTYQWCPFRTTRISGVLAALRLPEGRQVQGFIWGPRWKRLSLWMAAT